MRQTGSMGSPPAAASRDRVHAWDRFDRMWVTLFHVALGVPTVIAWVGSRFNVARWVGVLAAVAVVAGARQLAARALADVEEGSGRHLAIGLLWAVVTLPAMVVLVNAEQVFVFAMYGLFPQSFLMLPRNFAIAFAAALVPAVLIGAEGVSALQESDFVVSVVGSALLAPAIGLFIHAISRQSEQRHLAILALETAQREAESLLQASLAISRARTADEVLAAVGSCLAPHGVDRVALRAGADPLAIWSAPASGAVDAGGSKRANTTTVSVEAPGAGSLGSLALEVSGTAFLSTASRRTLETLATSCGLALANQVLIDRARQAGVHEERARLAREIHDTLAQGFVSVLTQLEASAESLSDAPDEVTQRVERATRIARATLAEARRSVQALRPVALDAATLPEAIERVVARWSSDSGVGARVTLTGGGMPLPAGTEVTLLRATQEALANVARHANATSVTVTLSFLCDAVVLDVHDDGRGFDPHAPRNGSAGGFGLQALQQRLRASGGFFGLESEPGRGTTLTVHVPIAGTEVP